MPEAKAVYDLANEVTGLDVAALCFEENDKLNITEYTQICMLTTGRLFIQHYKQRELAATLRRD